MPWLADHRRQHKSPFPRQRAGSPQPDGLRQGQSVHDAALCWLAWKRAQRGGGEQAVTALLRDARLHEHFAERQRRTGALFRTSANPVAKSEVERVSLRLMSTRRRIVQTLQHSVRLAEQHAARLERSGQGEAAADEREAAQRARSRAEVLAVIRGQ